MSCVEGWPPGKRCHCTVCHRDFSSEAAFDLHRGYWQGRKPDDPCLPEDEYAEDLGFFGGSWGTDEDFTLWAHMETMRRGKAGKSA
jgi:hypothetical protein